MRWSLPIMLLVGCGEPSEPAIDAPVVIDAAIDSGPIEEQCPASSTLSICLSFDAAQLGAQLANEGAVSLSASAVDVMRTSAPTGGGAALFSATSTLAFPANTTINNIVAIDALLRLDQAIPAGMRVGIVDADNGMPGMSLFVYAGTVTPQQIRCTIGGGDLYSDATLPLGTWVEIGCTCAGGQITIRQNGETIAELAGCTPGAAAQGLQIGQNSRTNVMLPPNEPFIGAMDRVRLWTAVP